MKFVRTLIGSALLIAGIIFTILPGSILFVLAGLVLLSMDYPRVRKMLRFAQNKASLGARRLDAFLLKRKYR